jgi:RNA-binding protein
MNLTGKQKSFLRSLAMTKKAVFQIGKDGLTQPMIQTVGDYLFKNELVKIILLDSCPLDKSEIVDAFESQGFEIIQTIGKNIVLYQKNPQLEHGIVLPR